MTKKRNGRTQPKQEKKPMASVMDQVKEMVADETPDNLQVDAEVPVVEEVAEETLQPEASRPAPEPELIYQEIRVPVEEIKAATFRLHLDLSVSGADAVAIRKVAAGLDRNRATLKSGRRCVHTVDAVRWLIEQLT